MTEYLLTDMGGGVTGLSGPPKQITGLRVGDRRSTTESDASRVVKQVHTTERRETVQAQPLRANLRSPRARQGGPCAYIGKKRPRPPSKFRVRVRTVPKNH